MTPEELLAERAKVIREARGILNKAEKEKRDLTDEENGKYEELIGTATSLKEKADREHAQRKLDEELDRVAERQTPPLDPNADPGERRNTSRQDLERRALDRRDSGVPWEDLEKDEQEALAALEMRAMGRFVSTRNLTADEKRALQVDADIAGGYTVVSQEFNRQLIKAVDNAVHIRQYATKFPLTTAESLGTPTIEHDPSAPTWTSELSIGSEDTTLDFGLRELSPNPLAKFIKVSEKLLRKAALNPEAIVRDRLVYVQAVALENGYLNGSGAGQPLGLFTASAQGISTGRDVSTGNTATAIKFDGLKTALGTLKSQYRKVWLFHRDAITQISKEKDGNQRYLWDVNSTRVGEPDRLLGLPVLMSEYVPNTFTASLYVGLVGDLSWYWIADALDMRIQRLVELYAATNQIGFIIRSESDGMPVLEEAFVRVKLSA